MKNYANWMNYCRSHWNVHASMCCEPLNFDCWHRFPFAHYAVPSFRWSLCSPPIIWGIIFDLITLLIYHLISFDDMRTAYELDFINGMEKLLSFVSVIWLIRTKVERRQCMKAKFGKSEYGIVHMNHESTYDGLLNCSRASNECPTAINYCSS